MVPLGGVQNAGGVGVGEEKRREENTVQACQASLTVEGEGPASGVVVPKSVYQVWGHPLKGGRHGPVSSSRAGTDWAAVRHCISGEVEVPYHAGFWVLAHERLQVVE
jgi:hypothetical protein